MRIYIYIYLGGEKVEFCPGDDLTTGVIFLHAHMRPVVF